MSVELVDNEKKLDNDRNTFFDDIQTLNSSPKKQKSLKNIIPFSKKWRVKLYILNENGQWDDKGIGNAFPLMK